MSENLAIAITVVASVSMFGWVVKTIFTSIRQRRVAQLQAKVQERLLERFDSAQELGEFLRGDAGKRFLESVSFDRNRPQGRILGSIQATLVGIALVWLHGRWTEAEEALLFIGVLALALGVGFLLSAVATYFLSRHWGLMNGHEE